MMDLADARRIVFTTSSNVESGKTRYRGSNLRHDPMTGVAVIMDVDKEKVVVVKTVSATKY